MYICFASEPMIANGIHTDLIAYYDSLERVRSLGHPILPSHDPKVLLQKMYPAPKKI
jgi:hypothetical protein